MQSQVLSHIVLFILAMNEIDRFSRSFFNGGDGKHGLDSNECSENYEKCNFCQKIMNSSFSRKTPTSPDRPRITLRAWRKALRVIINIDINCRIRPQRSYFLSKTSTTIKALFCMLAKTGSQPYLFIWPSNECI